MRGIKRRVERLRGQRQQAPLCSIEIYDPGTGELLTEPTPGAKVVVRIPDNGRGDYMLPEHRKHA